jgi:hypothetical protein
MDLRTIQESLLIRNDIKELVISIMKKQEKYDKDRGLILQKYVNDTSIKVGNEELLINKNLIIYLFIKHGIDLSKPLLIENFKFNVKSKRLIFFHDSSKFRIEALIETLKRTKNQKYNLIAIDLKKYLIDNIVKTDINPIEFETRVGHNIWNIDFEHMFRLDEEPNTECYETTLKIFNLKHIELAKFNLTIYEKNKPEFDIEIADGPISKIENYTNEKYTSIITTLFDGAYLKLIDIDKKINEHIKLVNEFNLV